MYQTPQVSSMILMYNSALHVLKADLETHPSSCVREGCPLIVSEVHVVEQNVMFLGHLAPSCEGRLLGANKRILVCIRIP